MKDTRVTDSCQGVKIGVDMAPKGGVFSTTNINRFLQAAQRIETAGGHKRLKDCPRGVLKNIENYRKISRSTRIRQALKRGVLQGKMAIFCALAFSIAAFTRVKTEVQILYRPPTLPPKPLPHVRLFSEGDCG